KKLAGGYVSPRGAAGSQILAQGQFDQAHTSGGFGRGEAAHWKNSTALRNRRSPSPSGASPSRGQRGCCVGRTCRSRGGIRPSPPPLTSHRPATSPCEPFGLTG